MAKMMFACVLAYTLAWLPLNIYNVLRDIPGLLDALNETTHITLFFVVHWLAMSHTCYNPFIYFWMNSKFRAGYYRALGCLPCLAGVLRLVSSPIDGTVVRSGTYSSRYGTPKCHVRSLQGAAPTGPATSLQVLGPAPPHAGVPPLHYHNHDNHHHHQCPPSPASSAQPGLAVLYVVLVLLCEHGRMRDLLSRLPRLPAALPLDLISKASRPRATGSQRAQQFSLCVLAVLLRNGPERKRERMFIVYASMFICLRVFVLWCCLLCDALQDKQDVQCIFCPFFFLSVVSLFYCSAAPLFSLGASTAHSTKVGTDIINI